MSIYSILCFSSRRSNKRLSKELVGDSSVPLRGQKSFDRPRVQARRLISCTGKATDIEVLNHHESYKGLFHGHRSFEQDSRPKKRHLEEVQRLQV